MPSRLILIKLLLLLWIPLAHADDIPARGGMSLRVVLHVHSRASGEKSTFEEIAHLAKRKKIDAVILTDYFEQKISLGLAPFHRWIKISHKRESLKKFGLKRFFENVRVAQRQVPQANLMVGAEVTPYYWWSGNVFTGDLTVHDTQKNLLVFGIPEKAYRELPTLENGKSPHDFYQGPQGGAPYQAVIDTMNREKGFTIWSTPDEAFGSEFQAGPVRFSTPSYTQALLETKDYQGVAIYPEGKTKTGIAGGVWDQLLKETCEGKRKIIWAFAENVVHDHNLVEHFGEWDNKVYAKGPSESEILNAFSRGQFYIRENKKKGGVELIDFMVREADNTSRFAGLGEELKVSGLVTLKIQATVTRESPQTGLLIDIIRNGEVVHTETGSQGWIDAQWTDPVPVDTDHKIYYRLSGFTRPLNVGSFISNPIFVRRKSI